jgi:hypothetical protein
MGQQKPMLCRIIGYDLRMKKFRLLIVMICTSVCGRSQIANGVFGQNADLTATIGTNTSAGGHLDDYWDATGALSGQDHILASKTKFMRYGGINVETYCLIDGDPLVTSDNISKTIADYIAKAEVMQDNGITPMMTLPLKLDPGILPTVGQAAIQAGKLVKGVNDGLVAASYAPVTYWVYSNEPEGGSHGYVTSTAPGDIFNYIQAYYNQVAPVWSANATAWGVTTSDLKLVGPELYSYDNYNHGAGMVDKLVQQLLGVPPYTHAADITPYISVFTWHYYPFGDESTASSSFPDPTTSNVINRLTQNSTVVLHGTSFYTRALKDDINEAQNWIATYSSNSAVSVGITEANICYINDVSGTFGTGGTDDQLTGNGTNGFIAGQFWAEMMGICAEQGVSNLNFWSSIGGCDGGGCTHPLYETNTGFLNSDPTKFGGLGGKKPTYYHYKLMAENFAGGTPLANSYVNSNVAYKAFAYTNSTAGEVGVLVMNQDNAAHSFKIYFNGGSPSGYDMMFSFASAGATDYNCTSLAANTSLLLIFPASGGAPTENYFYGLQDALRGPSDIGPMSWVGGTSTINNLTQYGAYTSTDVYTDIYITPTTAITAATNNVFQFTNTARIDGSSAAFSSGTSGTTLCITHTDEATCH